MNKEHHVHVIVDAMDTELVLAIVPAITILVNVTLQVMGLGVHVMVLAMDTKLAAVI